MTILSRLLANPIIFFITLVIVASIGFLPAPFRLVSLPLLTILLACVLPKPKSISLTTWSIISFVLVAVASQAIALLMWLVNGHFTWQILILFITLTAFLAYYFRWRRGDLKPPAIINHHDVFSITLAAVSVGIIVVGALSGGELFQQLIRFTFQGYDNTAHIATIMADYSQSSYVYGVDSSVVKATIFNGVGAYPQGWHLFTATLFHGYSDHLQILKSFETILGLLVITTLLWYFILVFLATRFILYIVDWFSAGKRSSFVIYTATTSASVLFQILGGIQSVKFGFINYLAIIVYLVVLVMLGFWAFHKKADSKLSPTSFVIYGSLLATGSALTWILPAPAAFLFVGLIFALQFKRIKQLVVWLKSNILTLIVVVILIALSALQIWIHIVFGRNTDDLNAAGPGWYVSYTLLISMVVAIAWWTISKKNRELGFTKLIFITILSIGLITAMIYIYQMASVQNTNYYYNKMAALFIMILIILIGAIGTISLQKLSKKIGLLVATVLAISSVLIIPFITNSDLDDVGFAVGGMRSITPDTADKIVDIIHKDNNVNYGTVIVMRENGTNEDLMATRPLSLLFRGDMACTNNVLKNLYYTSQDSIRESIITCAKDHPGNFYFVLSSKANHNDLVNLYKDYSNIKVLE